MKYEDLPAAARAQVDAKLGREEKKRARGGGGATGGPCPYLCKACGEESPTWPKAESHARSSGHVRQEMILPCPS